MQVLKLTSRASIVWIAFIYLFVANLLFLQRTAPDDDWTNLRYDAGVYYAYLPATFIKKDPLWNFLDNPDAHVHEKGVQYWAERSEKGKWIPKVTMGKALMDLPFFLAADGFVTWNKTHKRTGFSKPYKYAIVLSTVFYALMGMILLRSVLLNFFTDKTTALVLLLLALATNLYLYTTHESGMSHPHTFFLLSAALWLSIKWTDNRHLGHAAWFGLICGLIVLIRPINLLLLLPLPFLSSAFQNKNLSKSAIIVGLQSFFISRKFLIALFAAFLILFPQMLFWKLQSGSWFYYSYGDEEGFFFSKPQVWNGLFSFRKGWFIYTPIMFFAAVGLLFLFKKRPWMACAISLTFIVLVYITFSWWCWWYGGGFSARTLIDFYPYLALGLAAFISFLQSANTYLRKAFASVFIFLVGLNLFQSYQFKIGILHADAMNWEVYKGIFLKTKRFDNYFDVISHPDYEGQKRYGSEKKQTDLHEPAQ